MVAKSFQAYIQECEPYLVKDKMYVNMRNPKTGNVKVCRWYSEKEYAKLYPEAKIQKVESTFMNKTQKEVLGFEKGYITIFKGDTYGELEWFRASNARFARGWGWYIISTEEIPSDLPEGIEPIQLPWECVGQEDGTLKAEHLVKEAVEALIYNAGTSEFQGQIGERLEVTVTINSVYRSESSFGSMYNMHIMSDDNGNEYIWTTSSKCWSVGERKTIRGTVKEFRTYKNQKQTVLSRCVER